MIRARDTGFGHGGRRRDTAAAEPPGQNCNRPVSCQDHQNGNDHQPFFHNGHRVDPLMSGDGRGWGFWDNGIRNWP